MDDLPPKNSWEAEDHVIHPEDLEEDRPEDLEEDHPEDLEEDRLEDREDREDPPRVE